MSSFEIYNDFRSTNSQLHLTLITNPVKKYYGLISKVDVVKKGLVGYNLRFTLDHCLEEIGNSQLETALNERGETVKEFFFGEIKDDELHRLVRFEKITLIKGADEAIITMVIVKGCDLHAVKFHSNGEASFNSA